MSAVDPSVPGTPPTHVGTGPLDAPTFGTLTAPMRLSVIGTGYVGLVSGACLAHVGHHVQCVDIDEAKVARINAGECPIHEDGLPELLAGVSGRRLSATTDLAAAVASTDMTLIAVGTPFGEDRIDLAQIEAAAEAVGGALADKDGYHVVAVKSTVVPGTTDNVVTPILAEASGREPGVDFGVGMNPEFLREGVAVADFLQPDRIVVGGIDDRAREVMARLYAPFDGTDLIRTTPATAEMIKYTANSLLATLISFSNEIGNLSAAVGVDMVEVLEGVHLDHRFAPLLDSAAEAGDRVRPGMLSYLFAGCGFGGSCFPKDVRALAAHAAAHDVDVPVLQGALEVNDAQPDRLVELVTDGVSAPARVAVLGVAFKPGTDDIRESPTLRVVPALVAAGYQVELHDPIALDNARAHFGSTTEVGDGGVGAGAAGPRTGGGDGDTGPSAEVSAGDGAGGSLTLEDDLDAALGGADAVVLVTAWPEYASLADRLGSATPLVVDGRRFLDPAGFARYAGIGFPSDRLG